jgi:hypothetical protein
VRLKQRTMRMRTTEGWLNRATLLLDGLRYGAQKTAEPQRSA